MSDLHYTPLGDGIYCIETGLYRHGLAACYLVREGDRVAAGEGWAPWLLAIPWLLAACVLAISSLGWHFWGKFAAKPWMRTEADDRGAAEKTDNKEKQVP